MRSRRSSSPLRSASCSRSCRARSTELDGVVLPQALPRLRQRVQLVGAAAAACCERAEKSDGRDPDHGASVYGSTRRDTPAALSSPAVPTPEDRLDAYARLAVRVGLNLQP